MAQPTFTHVEVSAFYTNYNSRWRCIELDMPHGNLPTLLLSLDATKQLVAQLSGVVREVEAAKDKEGR